MSDKRITKRIKKYSVNYTIAIIAVIFCLILTSCGKEYIGKAKMDGVSMEPTILEGQELIFLSLDGIPKNGDLILINHKTGYQKPLVKRVIAIQGQYLNIDFDNNEVYVDGVKLDEPYTQGVTVRGDIPDEEINIVIPEGKVFVLGDNRRVSLDSRHEIVGLIDIEDIGGIIELP